MKKGSEELKQYLCKKCGVLSTAEKWDEATKKYFKDDSGINKEELEAISITSDFSTETYKWVSYCCPSCNEEVDGLFHVKEFEVGIDLSSEPSKQSTTLTLNIKFNLDKLKSDLKEIIDLDNDHYILRLNEEESEIELVVDDVVYGYRVMDYIEIGM